MKEPARAVVEEHTRIRAWARARGLGEDDGRFKGRARGLAVSVDAGCDGDVPEGVSIGFAAHGHSYAPAYLVPRRAKGHPLEELFVDVDLFGSLRVVDVEPDVITLRFIPLRAPEVFDRAIARVAEALAPPPPPPPETCGPYR